MNFWFKNYDINQLKVFSKNTMIEFLEIEITEIGENYLVGKMPVTNKTVQPARILHGGASVVLAESLGSLSSYLIIDPEKYRCVGLEINANHIRSIKENEGFLNGKANPIHIGKKTHVWDIQMTNDEGKLVCISRLTMAILDKNLQ